MKNAIRDRRAGVVREMIGKSMLDMFFFFFFALSVFPYPPEASAGCPASSVLAVFLQSSFSSTFSSSSCSPPSLCPAAVRDIPSKKSRAHGGWRHRCAPNTLQLELPSPL